jgi:eukaryotic-like serine/threonine-protein kinase
VIGSRYRLLAPLGRGGMGVVWRALHLGLDMEVAVKLIDDEGARSACALRRFRREAQAAAALRTPHVVRVHDFGVDCDRPFLVMELLEGEDLAQRLARSGPLSLSDTARLAVQLAVALEATHGAGLVHRDVKPSNIFLARESHGELAKLLDFGIVKDVRRKHSHDHTESGTVVGSPRYMSPEQLRGGEVDHTSDLWSLGVVVFEALTGVPLFEGRSLGDVFAKILTDPMLQVADLAPDLPEGLDDALAIVLERDPSRRCSEPHLFVSALVAIAEAHPDAVAPSPAATKAGSAIGRSSSTVTTPGLGLSEPPLDPDKFTDTLGAVDTTGQRARRTPRRLAKRSGLLVAFAGVVMAAYFLPNGTAVPLGEAMAQLSQLPVLRVPLAPAPVAEPSASASSTGVVATAPASRSSEALRPEIASPSGVRRLPLPQAKEQTEGPAAGAAAVDPRPHQAEHATEVEVDPLFGIRREKRGTP